MNIPWPKFLIAAAVGYGISLLLCKNKILSYQGQFFGFSGPQIGLSQDVQTPNCTPSNMTGNGLARYCNPPAGAYNAECSYGVDCADARAVYCRTYARGGVCYDYGQVAPNQGLPGQGPVIGSAFQDIANSFGFNPYTQQFGSYAPSTLGYGYQPSYNPYNYNPYSPSGYGYNPYGYNYPQQSYGYGYGYNYNYNYPLRRAYQAARVRGYDKDSGHFLYGWQAQVTPVAGGAAKLPPQASYDQSIVTPCISGDC